MSLLRCRLEEVRKKSSVEKLSQGLKQNDLGEKKYKYSDKTHDLSVSLTLSACITSVVVALGTAS